MTVRQMMSNRVISIESHENAEQAAKMIAEHNIGSLPVVNGGKLCGMITDRDIVLRCVSEGKEPERTKVRDIMTSNISFVSPNQEVEEALDLMAQKQIRRLPVVENEKMVGILTIADIARAEASMEISKALSEISLP